MTYQTINPTTGKLIKTYPDISDQSLEIALVNAHKAFETNWRHRPIAERSQIISATAAESQQRLKAAWSSSISLHGRPLNFHSEVSRTLDLAVSCQNWGSANSLMRS